MGILKTLSEIFNIDADDDVNISSKTGDVVIATGTGAGETQAVHTFQKSSGSFVPARIRLPGTIDYSGDVLFNNLPGAALNFDIELGTTLSRFRIITTVGAALFTVNNSGDLIWSQTNQKIIADTSAASDTKGVFLCGGGSNSVTRGAFTAPCGNNYSGFNGVLILYSGDASSAYVDIKASSATLPTIRFTLTATEQWRMSSSELTGMNTTSNQIARNNDTGFLTLSGGSSAGAPATGAYVTLRGTSASAAGVAIFSSGTTTNCYCSYAAEGSGGTHRFSISAVDHIYLEAGFVFSNKVAGNESTGAGTALLGTNSPASTLSAPFKWLKIKTQDGSTAYFPVWK